MAVELDRLHRHCHCRQERRIAVPISLLEKGQERPAANWEIEGGAGACKGGVIPFRFDYAVN